MEITDIVQLPISLDEYHEAEQFAETLKRNKGYKTNIASNYHDIKGCLGQLKAHEALNLYHVGHEFNHPVYDCKYGGDTEFDIKIGGEIYDVKCRSWWNEKYFFNIDIFMWEQEESQLTDHYMFTAVDQDFQTCYILGCMSHHYLWNNLQELSARDKEFFDSRKSRYQVAGKIKSRDLIPFKKYIFRI